MQTYLVGGAVRDQLLGLPVADRDWVVVGATPEEMTDAGFRPVGKDFPVFLHPKTQEEYALARTERKSGKGYRGFTFHTSPEVTLEQDLIRRDLTINAMAMDEAGNIYDPYGGQSDLQQRLLRHVSDAFSEDPLRVLRVARFAARFDYLGFRVADETLELMRTLSSSGELEHLSAERIWQEFERALKTPGAATFLHVLKQCDALARILPELVDLNEKSLTCLSDTSLNQAEQRFALIAYPLISQQGELLFSELKERLRIPKTYAEIALDLARWGKALTRFEALSASEKLDLIEGLKLNKGLSRLEPLLAPARLLFDRTVDLPKVSQAVSLVQTIKPKTLLQLGYKGAELGEELRRRQLESLSARQQS